MPAGRQAGRRRRLAMVPGNRASSSTSWKDRPPSLAAGGVTLREGRQAGRHDARDARSAGGNSSKNDPNSALTRSCSW